MESLFARLKKNKVVITTLVFIGVVLYFVVAKVFFKSRVEALIEESRFNIASSKPEEALRILNIAMNMDTCETTKAKLYMWRGIAYSYLIENDKAIEDFFHALKFKGADKSYIYCRLAIIYQKTDRIEEFVKYFAMFKDEVPDLIVPLFPDYESINDLYFLTADYYISKDEYEKAAIVYSNTMLINPQKENLFFERGDCYYKSGQIEKAREDILRWLEYTPPEERSLNNLIKGNIIIGRYDEALKDLDRFRESDQDPGLKLYYQGKIRFLQGEKRLALECLRNYLKCVEEECMESKDAMHMIKQINNELPVNKK